MKLSQVKEYVTGVLKQWFTNKSILDKFNETETGELLYGTKAISSNPVLKYQKYLNTELDSCHCVLETDYTPIIGEYVPFVKKSGSFEINEGKIILKPGQRVQINIVVGYLDTSNSQYANITYAIKDYTNDIEIFAFRPINNDANLEYSDTVFCQYTNETGINCEIGLYVSKVKTSDTLRTYYTSLTAQEIGRQIIIDPVEYLNTEQGLEDTPVGHIISHMGIEAPNHYLICDGAEYNIADYPYLAQHMIDSFGSVNHFGGDGITTFAVPDLRGEFLRGSGTAARDTGSGGEVGEHQDGTQHINFRLGKSTGHPVVSPNSALNITNQDKNIGQTSGERYDSNGNSSSDVVNNYYTSRPTNTSVLYCIKYEPTYYMNVQNPLVGRSETVLFEGNYSDTHQSNTLTFGVTLNDSIENYDELYFEIYSGEMLFTRYAKVESFVYGYPSLEISEHATTEFYASITLGFVDSHTLSIGWLGSAGWVSPHISKVIGVKYQEAQLENNTDEDINTAIAEAVAEINEEVQVYDIKRS